MKFGVIIFPGSNCDRDAYWTVEQVLKQPVTFLWHESHDLENCDAIIVPGGFAYGDYLRTGAIAKFSPVMESVRKFADGGGLVLGICNGFQILCEAGLLPGALMRNARLKYVCKPVHIRVENPDTPYTNTSRKGDVLCIPIGHMEGNYFCDEAILAELRRDLQPRAKRSRHDAASGARQRVRARLHRRHEDFRVAGRSCGAGSKVKAKAFNRRVCRESR